MNTCNKCPPPVGSCEDAHRVVTGHTPRCPEYRLMHSRPLGSLELLERLVDEVRRLRGELRKEGTHGAADHETGG